MTDEFNRQLRELQDLLRDLPKNIEQNALKVAVFEAASLMADAAAMEAPVSDGAFSTVSKGDAKLRVAKPGGTLRRSIIPKKVTAKKGEVKSGVEAAYYAKWIEFGHTLKSHGKKKDRRVIGHVPPNPFMRRAFEANKEWALDVMRRTLIDEMERRILAAQRRAIRRFVRGG